MHDARTPSPARGGRPRVLAVSLPAVARLWLLRQVFDVTSFIGKTAVDVWAHLVTGPEAAADRRSVLGQLGTTLEDAAPRVVTGLVLAVVVAAVFALFRGVEHALMPLAMPLRSLPLVAMAPVTILVLGRREASVAAMGAVVVVPLASILLCSLVPLLEHLVAARSGVPR